MALPHEPVGLRPGLVFTGQLVQQVAEGVEGHLHGDIAVTPGELSKN